MDWHEIWSHATNHKSTPFFWEDLTQLVILHHFTKLVIYNFFPLKKSPTLDWAVSLFLGCVASGSNMLQPHLPACSHFQPQSTQNYGSSNFVHCSWFSSSAANFIFEPFFQPSCWWLPSACTIEDPKNWAPKELGCHQRGEASLELRWILLDLQERHGKYHSVVAYYQISKAAEVFSKCHRMPCL